MASLSLQHSGDEPSVELQALLEDVIARKEKLDGCDAIDNDDVDACAALCAEGWTRARALDLFPSSTVYEDVATKDLRLALLPLLRAMVLDHTKVADAAARLPIAERAAASRLEFLRLVVRLEIVKPCKDMERLLGLGDDDREPREPTPQERRQSLIDRRASRKAAEDEAGRTALELKRAEESSCVFDVDYVDEVRRDKIVAELAAAALVARDDAISDERELEMHRAFAARSPAPAPRRRPTGNADVDYLLGGPRGGGIRTLKVTQPLGAQTPIAVQREVFKSQVFRPTVSGPTMSLEELADRELADCLEREAKNKAAKETIPTIDADPRRRDELERDEHEDLDGDARYDGRARKESEEWARWKEQVKPGSGNRGGTNRDVDTGREYAAASALRRGMYGTR